MRRLLFALSAAALVSGSAVAQTLYVTDQFTLDIYEKPAADSSVAGSIPSGADVEVHGSEEGFLQVRAADGTEGWVSADYLTEQPPLRLKLEALSPAQREWLDKIAELQARLHTKQSELAALREPVLGETGAGQDQTEQDETAQQDTDPAAESETGAVEDPAAEAPSPTRAERQALEGEIGELRERIAELRKLVAAGDSTVTAELAATIEALREQNTGLRARIVSAHALLDGKDVPSGEQLARLRPGIPRWFWGVLVAAAAAGALIGAGLLDWRYRRRHGGFRI